MLIDITGLQPTVRSGRSLIPPMSGVMGIKGAGTAAAEEEPPLMVWSDTVLDHGSTWFCMPVVLGCLV